jgi:hypothetical protein
MSHAINNFCGHSPAFVSSNLHADCGPLVTLRQDSGSCSFLHSMTIAQAREMAQRLNDAADDVEDAAEEAAQQLNGVPA